MKYILSDVKDDWYLKGEIWWEHFHQDSPVSPDISMTSKIFFKKIRKKNRLSWWSYWDHKQVENWIKYVKQLLAGTGEQTTEIGNK